MELLNIGGGELLVIVLLAIILFGPEDILRIMRTIGNYTRKIQRMWAQVAAGLKGEFIPDGLIPEEILETIEETKTSIDEVKTTLEEVKTTVQTDIIDDTKATVEEVKETLNEVDTSVKSDMLEIPKAMRAAAKEAVAPKAAAGTTENEPDPESVQLITALLDYSSGKTADESTSKAKSTTTEDITAPEETDQTSPEVDETATTFGADETAEIGAANVAGIEETPVEAEVTDGEPDPKTTALIASLLEGRSRDTGDESASKMEPATNESADLSDADVAEIEETPVEAESSEETPAADPLEEPEPTPEVIPEPADVAPISVPEPVTTETTTQDEEV